MDWRGHSKNQDGALTIPDNWIFIHYYEAISLLFRVENALRVFVYVVLKAEVGETWENLEISSDENSKTSIQALARQRIEQNRAFGYLSYPINSPLMHLTSGELVRLIVHDSYWKYFKPYFMAAKNVVTLKLQEIGNIRNALAHFRPIKSGDVEVVKQNASQVLTTVEKTLVDIIRCDQGVPTNTDDAWYSALRSVGTQRTQLSFSQSVDSNWIRINMNYFPPILSQSVLTSGKHVTYKVINIRPLDVLRHFGALSTSVIFLSEVVSYVPMPKDLKPKFKKVLRFTFSRKTLSNKYDEIRKGFEELLKQIDDETDLLSEDQLARGKLLNSCNVSASNKGTEDHSWWDITSSSLQTSLEEEYPAEFWRPLYAFNPDFISNTEWYPWMPVQISEEEIDIPL